MILSLLSLLLLLEHFPQTFSSCGVDSICDCSTSINVYETYSTTIGACSFPGVSEVASTISTLNSGVTEVQQQITDVNGDIETLKVILEQVDLVSLLEDFEGFIQDFQNLIQNDVTKYGPALGRLCIALSDFVDIMVTGTVDDPIQLIPGLNQADQLLNFFSNILHWILEPFMTPIPGVWKNDTSDCWAEQLQQIKFSISPLGTAPSIGFGISLTSIDAFQCLLLKKSMFKSFLATQYSNTSDNELVRLTRKLS